MGGFALARIGIGASPLADGFPFGTVRVVPIMQRGAADRLEHIATRLARDRAHRNRVVRRAEGGGPNGGNIRIHRARQRCQPVDIAELPLIRRHAKRGIAFGVFDADKAFLRGKPHVRHFDIVLIIQPRLLAQLHICALRHHPDGGERRFLLPVGVRRDSIGGQLEPQRRDHPIGGGMGVVQDIIQRKEPTRGTGSGDKTMPVRPQRRIVHIGAEHGPGGIPGQLAAAMGPQMHHRRPSARHGDGVTGEGFKHRTLARLAAHLYACHAFAACHPRHGMTHHHANAQIFGACHQRGILRQHAGIQNGGHGQSGLGQGDGGAVGVVIIGDHHRAIPDRHAIVHQIIPHRCGQHHTGDVIACKGQRPFNRAGGGHDMTGANTPEPVARSGSLGRVVRQTFIAQHIAVVIDSRPHDTGAQGDVCHLRQLCHQRVNEIGDGCAIDRAAIHGRAAAPMGGLFQHDDLGTGQGRRARGL